MFAEPVDLKPGLRLGMVVIPIDAEAEGLRYLQMPLEESDVDDHFIHNVGRLSYTLSVSCTPLCVEVHNVSFAF